MTYRTLEELAAMIALNDMVKDGRNTNVLQQGGKVGSPTQNPGAFVRLGSYINADGLCTPIGWKSRKCGNEGYHA